MIFSDEPFVVLPSGQAVYQGAIWMLESLITSGHTLTVDADGDLS